VIITEVLPTINLVMAVTALLLNKLHTCPVIATPAFYLPLLPFRPAVQVFLCSKQ